jgi:hypothetical protein
MILSWIQILIGIAITIVLIILAMVVVHSDFSTWRRSVSDRRNNRLGENPKKPVVIVDGMLQTAQMSNRRFVTVPNVESPFAVAQLPKTVNRYGGSQFSYSWWIKLTDVSVQNIAKKIIFIRGDPKKYPLQKVDVNTGETVSSLDYQTHIVKCPLVRFGRSYKEIVLELNTTQDIEQRFVTDVNDPRTAKLMSLVPGRWTMMTFVVQDNVPIDDFERGIMTHIYFNDTLVTRRSAQGALKTNTGDLCFFPGGNPIEGGYISEFIYTSWAMTDTEISERFRAGPKLKCSTACGVSEKKGYDQPVILPSDDL